MGFPSVSFWGCRSDGRELTAILAVLPSKLAMVYLRQGSMLSAFLPDVIVNPDKKPGVELTSAVSPKQVTEATSDTQGHTTAGHQKSNDVQVPWQPMGPLERAS